MRPPPRGLVAVAIVVLAVTTVLAVLGAFAAGVSTDEPIHVMRLRNFFDTGWYALDWDYSGAGPGGEETNTYVYAPVTMLVLHGWSVLWGVEGWHEVATTSHAYDVRHLGVVLIALVGLAAVAGTGRAVLGSWRWGVVAAAVLAAIPLWTGHAMFNVKDVPVATGHTLVTLALILHVREARPRALLRLARSGGLVAGLVLTLGTRPGMWAGLGVVLVIAVVGVLLVSTTRRRAAVTLSELLLACGVAAAALVAIYPRLFGSPLRALPRTSESSSSFREGQSSDRFYVVRHLAEDLPTLLTGFAVVGAVVAVAVVVRRIRRDRVTATRLALVGAQAVTLPVVAVLLGSDLYHGLRQLLFAIPALAVLAGYGMAWWLERAQEPGQEPARFGRRLPLLVAGIALVLPTVDQITLQPYQTTYVNFATDVLSASSADDDRPGGDYWRVSIPELAARSALDRQLLCKATVDKETDLAHPFANGGTAFSTIRNTDCREEANGPLAPDGLPVVRQLPAEEYDAVFIGPLPSNCTPLEEVTRWRHGFEVVVSTMARCTVRPAVLPPAGVSVSETAPSLTARGDLWRYAVNGWLQWPGRQELTAPVPVAEVALRPSPRACAHGCRLVIEGTAPDDLVARVDGAEVPVRHGGPGVMTLPLRGGQSARPVWVTLSRRSGDDLAMTMSALSLASTSNHSTAKGQR